MEPKEDQVGKVFMSWEAHEYFHHEKGNDWYWWTGLGALILLVLAIYQGSFLFGVLVLVGWFTVVLYAVRPPRNLKFSLAERGVLVEKTLYPWQTLKSFWIFYNPPLHKDLSLESKKMFVPFIKIPLGKMEPQKVREIVIKFLPEVEQEESLIDNLSHLARF